MSNYRAKLIKEYKDWMEEFYFIPFKEWLVERAEASDVHVINLKRDLDVTTTTLAKNIQNSEKLKEGLGRAHLRIIKYEKEIEELKDLLKITYRWKGSGELLDSFQERVSKALKS